MATKVSPSRAPQICSPEQALQFLKEGNERFASGKPQHPNSDAARRIETAREGQHPFAAVLACADSRVPVEMIFDCGIGSLFVARVAGNVADAGEVATLEYAAEQLDIPLIVVLGHTQCGAVAAAIDGTGLHGNLLQLVNRIKPAVEMARLENFGDADAGLHATAVRTNVLRSMTELLRASETIRKRSQAGDLQIAGGVYDIETGRVEWLPTEPEGDWRRWPR